ncbi:CBS domain-containing protein [Alginatibacterium sediminis]|uniref:CBS domain-containing protein n=1 Tax=Alginatibacterium sediminis TaxID=2164068 RepID=A0A420ED40_9ALTE|nr:CBS domain-containing protein [Alginatibacterium sediminis]RKF18585.1 CBS domain-containing protein [Alginatibacterium sediminis]
MPLKSIKAIDYMTKNPVVVKPSTTLFDAIDMMTTAKVSGATVLNEAQEVVGIISEIDCLQAILKGSYHGEIGGNVESFMTKDVEVVDAEQDILAIAERLIRDKRRRLPVVRGGKFIGQFSVRSILSAVKNFNNKNNTL